MVLSHIVPGGTTNNLQNHEIRKHVQNRPTIVWGGAYLCLVVIIIEYTIEWPSVVHSSLCAWLVPTGVYLISFLIGKISYSPCSEPSRTVLFPDLTYTMYARHPSLHQTPPFTAPYHYSSMVITKRQGQQISTSNIFFARPPDQQVQT